MNTATPLQSFLQQMKQRSATQQQGNGKKGPRSYFVDPLYSRYMGNTGFGEDGKLQPKNPAAMVPGAQGPVMVHEGEDMYARPNGDMQVVPASMSQGRMRQMEKSMNIPGRSIGGIIKSGADALRDPLGSTKKLVTDASKVDTGAITNTLAQKRTEPGFENNIGTRFGADNILPNVKNLVPMNNGFQSPPPPAEAAGRAVAPRTMEQPAAQPAVTPVENYVVPAGGTTAQARVAPTRTMPTETALTPVQNQIAPAGGAVADTKTTTLPTGSSTHMQNAMGRLNDIMEGGSPALRAIQDRQLQNLKATQGLQDRVQGFEAAQAGLRPEAAAAGRAMGRAVAGSQLAGAQAEMAGNEMQQRETAAKDLASLAPSMQGMEIAQQNQVANMVNQGYTKDQINQQFGTKLSDTEYQSLLGASGRGQNLLNAKVAAGDFEGANQLLQQQGLPPIDWTKIKAGEFRQVLDDIDSLIDTLGPDADPNVIAQFAGIQAGVMGQIWKAWGVDSANGTMTAPGGAQVTLPSIVSNIDNPTDPQTVQTVARISDATDTFLNTTEGSVVMEQLGGNGSWDSLYTRAKDGDTAAAQEMGAVLGAAMTNNAYMTDPTAAAPTASQKALLEKYGVWREKEADTATINAKSLSIKDKLMNGDINGAKAEYEKLTASEKEGVGSFDDLSSTGLSEWAKNIVLKKEWTEIEGLGSGDPKYQAILKAMPQTDLSRTKSGENFVKMPELYSYIKFKDPDTGNFVMAKVTDNYQRKYAYITAVAADGTTYKMRSDKAGITKINP
jgi:hypothetical protein